MKIAVAGGTGFIGSHVVRHLVEAGHAVRVLARKEVEVPASVELVVGSVEAPLAPELLAGCAAVVNLVGIAHARDRHGFERAHVQVVQHLLEAARAARVQRFVHVSVVDVPSATGPYVETKRRGEACVRNSDLSWTILRPSMVYGEGDVALRNLVDGVARAAVFPVPAGPTGSLAPVHVADVAAAVAAALRNDTTVRETIDVVGPEDLDLRALVQRVSEALDLPTRTLPMPRWLMWLAAAIMQRVLPRPPLTVAQLGMLTAGLQGDPAATRSLLGVPPSRLTLDRIRSRADRLPRASARLVTSPEHRAWLGTFAASAPTIAWVLPLVFLLYLGLPTLFESPWASLGLANAISLGLVLLATRAVSWSRAWRPSPSRLAVGLGVAAVMIGAALGLVTAIRRWAPGVAAGADEVYGWAATVSPGIALPILLVIVVAEDWLWRGAVTLPLAARIGPWKGCLLAGALFAAAHATAGPPVLLLAAFLAGTAWSVLTVRTRSLFVTACCHATWDLAILTLAP